MGVRSQASSSGRRPAGKEIVTTRPRTGPIRRRTMLKTALAFGAARLASPFILPARGETPVRIGLVTPLPGPYAALGRNEQLGAEHAVDQINAGGGILGRPV